MAKKPSSPSSISLKADLQYEPQEKQRQIDAQKIQEVQSEITR